VTAIVPPQQRRRDRGRERRERFENKARRPRPSIDQLLKKGQEVVVQVTKEGIAPRADAHHLRVDAGPLPVLMPSLPKCGVSRKIEDVKERRRLKRIVRELDETGHGGIGFIVRTAASTSRWPTCSATATTSRRSGRWSRSGSGSRARRRCSTRSPTWC